MFCLDLFSEVLLRVCGFFFFSFFWFCGFVFVYFGVFCVCVCFDKCPVVYSLVSFFFKLKYREEKNSLDV